MSKDYDVPRVFTRFDLPDNWIIRRHAPAKFTAYYRNIPCIWTASQTAAIVNLYNNKRQWQLVINADLAEARKQEDAEAKAEEDSNA